MTTNTYTSTIDTYNVDVLETRVARLNKRAAKLGVDPLVVTYDNERTLTSRDEITMLRIVRTVVDVTVSSDTIALDGWRLLASVTLDAAPGEPQIVDAAPGVDVDPEWRYTRDECDHCHRPNTGRRLIVICAHDDGRVVRVGRSCVRDYLGHNINALTFFATAIVDIDDELANSDRHGERTYALDDLLAVTAAAVREHGWRSRSAAQAYNERVGDGRYVDATVDVVVAYTFERNMAKRDAIISEINDDDRNMAAAALAWARTHDVDDINDYLANIATIARRDAVSVKRFGLACSIVGAYKRHVEVEAERVARRAAASPVPVVNGRMVVTGTVLGTYTKESDYGTTYKMRVLDDRGFTVYGSIPSTLLGHTYVDDDNRMCCEDGVDTGDRVTFTARVDVSADDNTFGWFSRPTKAQIVERAAVAS